MLSFYNCCFISLTCVICVYFILDFLKHSSISIWKYSHFCMPSWSQIANEMFCVFVQMQSGVFGSSGAAQARALQQQQPPPQPSVPPLNSSQPSLRAQVPQFLSPQVCKQAWRQVFLYCFVHLARLVLLWIHFPRLWQVQAQLLQFAAKNIGLNPALLTSPINPQHMTLLNQLYQLQLVSSSLWTYCWYCHL